MDILKMTTLTSWRRSVAIYHIMEDSAEELGMTKEAALEAMGVKSKSVARRTASTIKNLIEFFGSEEKLEKAFERLEPYAGTPQKLWYAVVTLAKNGVKDPRAYVGKFTDLKGIGEHYAEFLRKARHDFREKLRKNVSVHIRMPLVIRDRYKELAKQKDTTMNDIMNSALNRYLIDYDRVNPEE